MGREIVRDSPCKGLPGSVRGGGGVGLCLKSHRHAGGGGGVFGTFGGVTLLQL